MTGRNNGSGDDPENRAFDVAVASAQAAVAGLADKYIGWVTEDLQRLDAAVASVRDGNDATAVRNVYDVAHDIKGQGSTFGYRLVTEIAHLLCRYVDDASKRQQFDRAVVDAHVTALRTVIDNRIQGDAGAVGREILDALKDAAAKSLG